jgi:ferric-dicitrate binding protein FerR (iron transport regulator)
VVEIERNAANESVDPGEGKGKRFPRIVVIRWVGAAAVLLVLAVGGWMYFSHSDQGAMQFALRSEGGVLRDTLEDGTIVTLNKHSRLKGLTHFTSTDRTVELEGEGFFEVASDKSRPFSVRTKDAVIRVLGTSFNVRSSGEQTEVIVETGRVVVGKEESQLIPLKAQERVVISSAGASVEGSHDELYNYYRTKEFVCNGTPLGRLVEVLNAAYGARIEIADSGHAKLPLTTTFQDGSLDEILQIVSKTLKLSIDKKEGRIILK